MALLDPQPDKAPLTVDRPDSYVFPDWYRWFFNLRALINATPQKLGTQTNGSPAVSLTNQSASIGATTIPLPALANGSYRVTAYARVTSPDGVSSSLAVAIGWTESSTALTQTLFTIGGTPDLVTNVSSASVTPFIDQNSALTYSTTYSSNTAAKMKYRLQITVEQV